MNEKDFNCSIFPPPYWFSPSVVIDKFNYYLEKYGLEKVLKHRNTKKLKEMWAGAVFLLGYSKLTDNEHWLQPASEDPPDVLGVCFVPHEKFLGSNSAAIINIEVTEWDSHSSDSLFETIKSKLDGKSYPDFYHLLVHVTRTGKNLMDFDELAEKLVHLDHNIAGIWILAGSLNEDAENYLLAWVFPKKAEIIFSLKEFYDRDKRKLPGIEIKKQKGDLSGYTIATSTFPDLN